MSAGSSLSCSSSSVSASSNNQQLHVDADGMDLPRAATMISSSSSGCNATLREIQWRKNALGKEVEKLNNHGKWSKEETHSLKQSIEQYCASKGIHAANLCSSADGKTPDVVRGAWGEIATVLPHRTVQSVYRKGLRTIHPFQRGKWTSEEEQLLVEMVQKHGKRWATIQHLLNRSVDSCRDKYREMWSKEYIRGRWDTAALQQLIRNVREILRIPSSKCLPPPPPSNNCMGQKHPPTTTTTAKEQLNNTNEETSEGDCASNRINDKNAGFPNESQTRYFLSSVKSINQYCEKKQVNIPWGVVSSRLENRSRLSCFRKWQKMSLRDMSDDNPADEDGCDDEHQLDNPEQLVQNSGASAENGNLKETCETTATVKPLKKKRKNKNKSDSANPSFEDGNIEETCETTATIKPLKKKRKHKKISNSAKASLDNADRRDDDENYLDDQEQLGEEDTTTPTENGNMKENCETSATTKASKKKRKNKKKSDSAKASFDNEDGYGDDENHLEDQEQLGEDSITSEENGNMKENCETSATTKASKKKRKNKKSSDSSAPVKEKKRKGKKSTSENVIAEPYGSILMLQNQEDVQLLKQLAATKASRPSDIDWAAGLSHPTAYTRYLQIIDTVERINDKDDVLDMPIASQAKALLQRAGHKNI